MTEFEDLGELYGTRGFQLIITTFDTGVSNEAFGAMVREFASDIGPRFLTMMLSRLQDTLMASPEDDVEESPDDGDDPEGLDDDEDDPDSENEAEDSLDEPKEVRAKMRG